MHQLIYSHDILDEIFALLSLNDLASTIAVNHCWFQASVPKLWKTVNLATVLSTLGRIEVLPDGHRKFVTPLRQENWKRFFLYSVHVQTLEGSKRCEPALETALSSFVYHSKLLMEDGIPYLFPACRDLKYEPSCRGEFLNLDPLISPNLEHFWLRTIKFDPIWFNRLCETIIARVSCLRVFRLNVFDLSNGKAAVCMDRLQQLLKKFESSLSFLNIPRVFFNESTLERVGDIRNLSSLIINNLNVSFRPSALPGYTERNGSGGLTSLQHLVFGFDVPHSFFHVLRDRFRFANLRHLTWFFGDQFDDVTLKSFTEIVVKACPLLLVFDIGRSRKFGPTSDLPVVKWSTIRPILGCKYLDVLSVHSALVAMTPDHFLDLLKSRRSPGWLSLELFTEKPLPLQTTLLLMTQYCPLLRTLAIHTEIQELDAYSLLIFPSVLEEGKIPGEYSFPSLTYIDFGPSVFRGPDTPVQLALLLFALCSSSRGMLGLHGQDLNFCKHVIGCIKAAVEFSQRRPAPLDSETQSLETEEMPLHSLEKINGNMNE